MSGLYLALVSLQCRHNGHDSVSNHQPRDCLLNRLFGRRSKKTSKLRVTGLCAGNSPGTAQMASNTGNVSIWWRHHITKTSPNVEVPLTWTVDYSNPPNEHWQFRSEKVRYIVFRLINAWFHVFAKKLMSCLAHSSISFLLLLYLIRHLICELKYDIQHSVTVSIGKI